MSGPLAKVLKTSTKIGIFGGTLYFVTTSGLWSDNKEYSSVKALQDLNQKADSILGSNVVSQVSIPKLDVTNRWNRGVEKSFDFLADFPDTLSSKYHDGLEYVSKKLE